MGPITRKASTGAKPKLERSEEPGKIRNHYHKELNQVLPTLEVQSFIKVDKPENSYVYKEF